VTNVRPYRDMLAWVLRTHSGKRLRVGNVISRTSAYENVRIIFGPEADAAHIGLMEEPSPPGPDRIPIDPLGGFLGGKADNKRFGVDTYSLAHRYW